MTFRFSVYVFTYDKYDLGMFSAQNAQAGKPGSNPVGVIIVNKERHAPVCF